jgi:glyoxylase-like metal-dependent hydrolase (beta-lactamase superfamily II)
MRIHKIETGFFKLDGGAMFGVVPKTMWNKLNPADENNLCTWAMRCLLIEHNKQLILVDTGIGNKQSEKFFSNYYLHGSDTLHKSLSKLGFHEDDITDVVFTHLHFDHCGGAIHRNGEKLESVFKNAKYWVNPSHWEWATQPNAREKASFLAENIFPIQETGQLNFIEAHSKPFGDHIDFITVNGHTEGMILPYIHHNGKNVLYCADLYPSIHHLPTPYVMAYDTRPLLTLVERQEILPKLMEDNAILIYEHDPVNEASTIIATDRGIRAGESLKISEIF